MVTRFLQHAKHVLKRSMRQAARASLLGQNPNHNPVVATNVIRSEVNML